MLSQIKRKVLMHFGILLLVAFGGASTFWTRLARYSYTAFKTSLRTGINRPDLFLLSLSCLLACPSGHRVLRRRLLSYSRFKFKFNELSLEKANFEITFCSYQLMAANLSQQQCLQW